MKKITFLSIPLIAIGVILFIIYFLIDINPVIAHSTTVGGDSKKLDIEIVSQESSWLNKLGFNENKVDVYPVNELVLNIDLENVQTSKKYQLVTKTQGIDELKTIKHLLNESLVDFVVNDGDDNSSIIKVKSSSLAQLHNIDAKLKHYNISTTLGIEED